MRAVELAEQSHRVEGNGDARFHIKNSRTPNASIADAKRHLLECADVPNGIDVTQQQHGLRIRDSGEIGLNVIAGFGSGVDLSVSAVVFEAGGKEFSEMVERAFVAAGGFHLDHCLEVREELLLPRTRVGKRND